MDEQILHTEQTKTCQTCALEPLPQSSQHNAFLVLQLILLFINIKFSLITLCLGYAFSRTLWICPLCKRDVPMSQESQNTNNHIIIRIGDCMMLISKNKFRLIASVVVGALLYLYITEPSHKPHVPIEKSWESLVTNCGYEAHLQNSVRANYLYNEYSNLGEWQISAVFLSREKAGKFHDEFLKVKMVPSQFTGSEIPDFKVFIKNKDIELQKGDQVKLIGSWIGRIHHLMVFQARKIQKTGEKIDPNTIRTFEKSFRRGRARDRD